MHNQTNATWHKSFYRFRILSSGRYKIKSHGLFWSLMLVPGLINPVFSKEGNTGKKGWVTTWSTACQLVEPNNMPPAPGLTNHTLRQVICVSIGGKKLRLRFSNEFSNSPVTLVAVQVAVSKGGSLVDASTTKTLLFNGRQGVNMQAGGEITSDPVLFNLKPRMLVAITIYFGQTSPTLTGHPGSRTTSYLLAGNQPSADPDFTDAATIDHWYAISAVDVEATKSAAAIAVIGDSITDGRGSGINKQNRWPDILAMALNNDSPLKSVGVLNLGIGGNCVLRGGLGPTALSRFDHDILEQKGLRWLIIFEGVNDLGSTRDSTAAAKVANDLIAAYDKMILQAHAQGIKVYGGTITPIKRSFYYQPYREAARNAVNIWIWTSGHFDGVIDFDKTIRDSADTLTMLPDEQSGDYLHPNELGYQKLGESIDLSLFK